MKNIFFTLIFSIFSLYAKNLQPLTHEEVKHFRVVNAQAIRAAKAASIYDAIGIFALCKRELEGQSTGCIFSLGDRVEYFSRLSTAVSLGIGFDAGIINKPMNSTEAGVFKGMAKALGNQLQRAAAFVTLAEVPLGFEHTHLQGFDNAIKTGTMRGPHTIDLVQVTAEKSNAPLRAKLAREYADLPRVNTYDQAFEIALLARIVSINPAYTDALQGFLNDTDLPLRPGVSLISRSFMNALDELRVVGISAANLIECLGILRETNEEKTVNMFQSLEMLRRHATARDLPFDGAVVSSIIQKLNRMPRTMCNDIRRVITAFPGISPIHLPDFSGYISTYLPDKQEVVIEVIRNAMVDISADNVDAVKKVLMQRSLTNISRLLLRRVLPKFIQMVKRADNKPSVLGALNRLVGLGLLEKLPARNLEDQIDFFSSILQEEAIVSAEDLENPNDTSVVKKEKIAIRAEKVSLFGKKISLFLAVPEGGFDDTTGEEIVVNDPFPADRAARFALITGLASLRISAVAKVRNY